MKFELFMQLTTLRLRIFNQEATQSPTLTI